MSASTVSAAPVSMRTCGWKYTLNWPSARALSMSANSSTRPRRWTRTQSSYRSTFVASRFARYIAMSAARSRSDADRPCRGANATPTLTSTRIGNPRTESGCASSALSERTRLSTSSLPSDARSQGLEHSELVPGQPRGHGLGRQAVFESPGETPRHTSPTSCPNSSLTSLDRSGRSASPRRCRSPTPPTTMSTRWLRPDRSTAPSTHRDTPRTRARRPASSTGRRAPS